MKILGIDLAGSEKRKTGICLLDEKLNAQCQVVFSNEEIFNLIKKENPSLIAIDAPLSLPFGRKSLEKKSPFHFRKADLELFKMKIKFFPITLGPMRMLTKRGIFLKEKLKKKYRVIEVYPGATQDILGLPRKQKGEKKLLNAIKKLGIKISQKNLTADELDAICCALTGYLFLKKKTISLGNKKEGQIIVPQYGLF